MINEERIINFIKKRKNFILFAALRVLVMIMSLITNIFIVRKLSVNDYGIFSVALMFVGLVTTFGFNWSSSSILYYGSRERAKTGTINKTFWARNIIIAVSLAATTILFVIFRNQINNYIGLDVSFLILIWLYVSVAEDYLIQYFLAVKKQLTSSMLSITAKIIYLFMIFVFTYDVKTLILLNIISHATVLLYLFGIKKSDIGKFEFDKDWFKEILNFSLWQLFGFSGLYFINFGDTAVINYFMTTEDVGIYNAAYKLFNAIAGFSYIISNYYASSIGSYFTAKQYQKLKQFFYRERFLIFALSVAGHILVILFSRPIISILYGDRYSQSTLILNILMVGSIFSFWGVFNMLYYNTNNMHKINQTINIFRAFFNIFLDIILVKRYGVIGAATATTIAIITSTIISTYYCEASIRKLLNVDGLIKAKH